MITLEFVKEFGEDDPLDPGAVDRNFRRLQSLLQLIASPHSFIAAGTGTQSAASGVATKFPYANEIEDPAGVYDLANTQFVAPMDGFYVFRASIAIPSPGAVGTRWIWQLHVNGAATVRLCSPEWTASTWSNDQVLVGDSGRVRLNKADTVDARITHNNAATLAVGSNSSANTRFTGGQVF